MSNPKVKVSTVTRHDCEWQTFRGSGNGGQAQQKHDSAVRCIHRPSGAVGLATEDRSQWKNRQTAFRRMAESKEFQLWAKIQAGVQQSVESVVEEQMDARHLKVEIREEGKWVENDLPG